MSPPSKSNFETPLPFSPSINGVHTTSSMMYTSNQLHFLAIVSLPPPQDRNVCTTPDGGAERHYVLAPCIHLVREGGEEGDEGRRAEAASESDRAR